MAFIIPGDALKRKIDSIAKGVAEKPHLLPKLVDLATKDVSLAFLTDSNEFHPYFLSRLHDFKHQMGTAPATETGTNNTQTAAAATTTSAKPGTALEKAVAAARAQAALTQDPHPDRFSLPLSGPNSVVPALDLDVMRVAALYAAKVGDEFWEAAVARFANRMREYDFLKTDHPRHRCFAALRSAYALVLQKSDSVQADLERDCGDGWLEAVRHVCEEKKAFALAEAARRKASQLSEPELRAKLLWNEFSVLGRFSKADLGIAQTAIPQPSRAEAPLRTTNASSVDSIPVFDRAATVGRSVTAATIAFRDSNGVVMNADVTGEVLKAQTFGDGHEDARNRADKRARTVTGLATEDEMKRNLAARYNRPQDPSLPAVGPAFDE
jgi:hypothetical protein